MSEIKSHFDIKTILLGGLVAEITVIVDNNYNYNRQQTTNSIWTSRAAERLINFSRKSEVKNFLCLI